MLPSVTHVVSHHTDLSKIATIALVDSLAKAYEQGRLLIVATVSTSRQIVNQQD